MENVGKVGQNLKNSSYEGLLSTQWLKMLWPIVGNEVFNIINKSFVCEKLLDLLKVSCVVPIKEVPNSINHCDMGPINLLPVIEKVMESILFTEIKKLVDDNNMLSHCQSGFREKHSPESALQFVVEQ